MGYLNTEKKWVFPLVISSLVCIFLLATSFNMGLVSSLHTINSIFSIFPSRAMTNETGSNFVEAKINQVPPPPARPPVPKFAYLISGSKGDLEKLWRTLHALYHPWNYYVVHLDLESPVEERWELASRVGNHSLFAKVGNVFVNNKSNMVTYRGPTMVANTLHACAILLKRHKDWDWFINLSASDYPLVTQDGEFFIPFSPVTLQWFFKCVFFSLLVYLWTWIVSFCRSSLHILWFETRAQFCRTHQPLRLESVSSSCTYLGLFFIIIGKKRPQMCDPVYSILLQWSKGNAIDCRSWTLPDNQVRHIFGYTQKKFTNSIQIVYWLVHALDSIVWNILMLLTKFFSLSSLAFFILCVFGVCWDCREKS